MLSPTDQAKAAVGVSFEIVALVERPRLPEITSVIILTPVSDFSPFWGKSSTILQAPVDASRDRQTSKDTMDKRLMSPIVLYVAVREV